MGRFAAAKEKRTVRRNRQKTPSYRCTNCVTIVFERPFKTADAIARAEYCDGSLESKMQNSDTPDNIFP